MNAPRTSRRSAPARGYARARVLAQPRSGRRDARVQGVPAPRVPAERLGVARSRRPPRLSEVDGRVAGAGRRQRLHAAADRGARAVRPAARGARPRQAAVLRHRDDDERRRAWVCSSRATRAGRRRSKAIPITRRAAAPPTSSRRPRFSASTIRTGRRRSPTSATSDPFSAFVAADAERARRAEGDQGRGHPHPHRDGRVADAGRADSTAPAGGSRRPSGCSGSPFGRHNAREGSRLAFGEYVDAQYAVEKADVILSLDADFLCAGAGGLRHARAFASRRRIEGDRGADQPAVRRRKHADQHRHESRSSAAAPRLARSRRSRTRSPRGSA